MAYLLGVRELDWWWGSGSKQGSARGDELLNVLDGRAQGGRVGRGEGEGAVGEGGGGGGRVRAREAKEDGV